MLVLALYAPHASLAILQTLTLIICQIIDVIASWLMQTEALMQINACYNTSQSQYTINECILPPYNFFYVV